jgi:hypothetical protein
MMTAPAAASAASRHGVGAGEDAMRLATVVGVITMSVSAIPVGAEEGRQALRSGDDIQYRFGGPIGSRILGNVEEWLKQAPDDNPGDARNARPPGPPAADIASVRGRTA